MIRTHPDPEPDPTPILHRAVNTRNHWRPPFPSLTSGVEKRFDDAGMLSARGPYVQSQRMAWAPFFAVARCAGARGWPPCVRPRPQTLTSHPEAATFDRGQTVTCPV